MPHNEHREERDEALEQRLQELGRDLDYPPTPDLAAAVRQRLEGERRTPARRGLPPWVLAAAVVAVFVVVPFASYNLFDGSGGGSSDAGGGRVAGDGAGGGEDAAPQSAARESAAEDAPTEATPPDAGTELDVPSSGGGAAGAWGGALGLGEPTTLEAAERRMGGGLLLPAVAGSPSGVYATTGPTGGGVALVYGTRADYERARPGTGFVLTQLPGGVEAAFGAGAGAAGVEVGGERGVWVPGPRASGAGGYRITEGLGGSALYFSRDGVALRLESNLTREGAIRVAESVG